MTEFLIRDLAKGRLDAAGAVVQEVYTRVDPIYAVYRTDSRVMIQFADDPILGSDQRRSLAPIYIARGQVNSYLDDLKATRAVALQGQAARYERRLADALLLGLQGQSEQSFAEIEGLKAELVAEQASTARLTYLLTASGVAVATLALIVLFTSPLFQSAGEVFHSLWLASAVGAVGAFVSIAIAIRDRKFQAERILRDNIVDAALRILIGALAGAILMALIRGDAFGLIIGGAEITSEEAFGSGTGPLLVMLVGLIGGFSERLVPDLLGKAVPTEDVKPVPPVTSSPRNELNPLGAESAARRTENALVTGKNTADEEVGCNEHPHDTDTTLDEELPAAKGGVETKPAD